MRISAKATFNAANVSGLLSKIAAGAVAGVTEAGQQTLAIEQALTPVATGALRDSETCVVTQDATSVEARVGPQGIFYDEYVEYGTGRRGGPAPYAHVETWAGMSPEPYARPAMDEITPQVAGIVADAIKDAL
jgi:HK97 gp10 family phage protein